MQSAPPRVAGVGIGDTAPDVRTTLGNPDRQQETLGIRFWDYFRQQVTVIWREDESGVQGIVVRGVRAGAVSGVKIGDVRVAALQSLGNPTRVRQYGRYLDFVGAHWVLTVEVAHDTVVQMTLMQAIATRTNDRRRSGGSRGSNSLP